MEFKSHGIPDLPAPAIDYPTAMPLMPLDTPCLLPHGGPRSEGPDRLVGHSDIAAPVGPTQEASMASGALPPDKAIDTASEPMLPTDAPAANAAVSKSWPDARCIADAADHPTDPASSPPEFTGGHRHTFEPIDRLGDPGIPKHEKVEKVLDVESLLLKFGADPGLAREVGEISDMLRPMATMVLAQMPDDAAQRTREGRGDYDTIPLGDVPVVIYTKGTGTEESFVQVGDGRFPGYPSDPDNMFFDDLQFRQRARILGTEPVCHGVLEAVNAASLFVDVAKASNINTVQGAIEAGMTIPLNVMYFTELSGRMGELIDQRHANSNSPYEAPALAWPGNNHLGTVQLIVPSAERLETGYRRGDLSLVSELLTDQQAATDTGRTLRMLIDAGWRISQASSHMQNIYRAQRGRSVLFALADNSDIYPLGDFCGRGTSWSEDRTSRDPGEEDHTRNQQIAAIYEQLVRTSGLVPIHSPIVSDDVRVTMEQVRDCGVRFWGEMLKGIAAPEAIEVMVRLLPFMRTEFLVATASLIVNQGNTRQWAESAQHRQRILEQFEEPFGALTEYRARFENSVRNPDLPAIIGSLGATGKIDSVYIEIFLRKNNPDMLRKHYMLGKLVRLSEAIENIPDTVIRDTILAKCSSNFSQKEIALLNNGPDLIRAFEGRHYVTLRRLIENQQYDDALRLLKIVELCSQMETTYGNDRTGELAGHKYLRMLLEDADYPDILQQAECEFWLHKLAQNAAITGLTLEAAIGRRLLSSDPLSYDVGSAAEAEGLPGIHDVVSVVLGRISRNKITRALIHQWAGHYRDRITSLHDMQDPPPSPDTISRIISELGSWTAQFADEIPELALLHHCHATGLIGNNNPALAQHHFDEAMEYYHTQIAGREQVADMPLDAWKNHCRYEYDSNKERLAVLYSGLGLHYIARSYRKNGPLDNIW